MQVSAAFGAEADDITGLGLTDGTGLHKEPPEIMID